MQIDARSIIHIFSDTMSAPPGVKIAVKTGSSGPPPAKNDDVRISHAARSRSAPTRKDDTLSPERMAEIRQRVLDGAYNSLSVIDHVARRILVCGDLG
jgi:anti-sigma28 factor (negative regulator of flagellin synthesis)